MIREIDTRHI